MQRLTLITIAVLSTSGLAFAQSEPSSAPLVSAEPPAPAALRVQAPVRDFRRLYVGGNLGWNDYGGLGAAIGYNVHRNASIRLGGGVGLGGARGGLQGRYYLFDSPFTPFVGAGLLYGIGYGNTSSVEVDGRASVATLPSGFYAQGFAGFEWLHRSGFTLGMDFGYGAPLFQNVIIHSGYDTRAHRDAISSIFTPSGLIIGLNLGATISVL